MPKEKYINVNGANDQNIVIEKMSKEIQLMLSMKDMIMSYTQFCF